MEKKYDFIINEDNEEKTYSFIDSNNETRVEWFIVINNNKSPIVTINLRGVDNAYNPLFYFVNRLILNGKLKSLSQINKINIPNGEKSISIKKEYIHDIQNVSVLTDSRVAINLTDISNYPELLAEIALDEDDRELEEE